MAATRQASYLSFGRHARGGGGLMWGLVARMLVVFGLWGGAMALAIAAGAPARTAELWAAAGAGVTLVLVAMLGSRPQRPASLPVAPPEPVAAPERERERASV